MDDLEQLRQDRLARMQKQNDRRAKAGKDPMHKNLGKLQASAAKRAALPVQHNIIVKKTKNGLPMPESGNIDDSALSFEEWKSCGYTVKKGEKSEFTDILGEPQFTMLQVHKINPAWAKWRAKNQPSTSSPATGAGGRSRGATGRGR